MAQEPLKHGIPIWGIHSGKRDPIALRISTDMRIFANVEDIEDIEVGMVW